MPFYYRGKNDSARPRRSQITLRIATLTALIGYPAGCLVHLIFPDTTPQPGLSVAEIAGFALFGLSLLAFGVIAPSWMQRIVGEQTDLLDEFELDLRRRAYVFSYHGLSAAMGAFLFYMAIGVDLDASGKLNLWTPSTYDHWNAIFWGVLLYAFVLPTTWLAWAGPAPLSEDDDAPA
jgi:hypothetical protein